MLNQRMKEKLERGECIDVSKCRRTAESDYILEEFIPDADYCNAETEAWIWSIGKDLWTGKIYASHSNKFYLNDKYECLWLR